LKLQTQIRSQAKVKENKRAEDYKRTCVSSAFKDKSIQTSVSLMKEQKKKRKLEDDELISLLTEDDEMDFEESVIHETPDHVILIKYSSFF